MAQMPEAIILRKTEETKAGVIYCMADVKTNADRIRSMSDEEFVTAICKHEGCPFRETEDDECFKHRYDCKACWLDWLRQEANDVGQ